MRVLLLVWVGLASAAAAQQPVTLFVAPVANGITEYRSAELDKLIADALASSTKAKSAGEAAADVLVKPELSSTSTGKVRVVWSMKNRVLRPIESPSTSTRRASASAA